MKAKRNKFKIILSSVTLLLAVIVLGLVLAQKYIIDKKLAELPSKLIKYLPKGSSFEILSVDNSLFHHSGLLDFTVVNSNPKLNSKILIEYNINNDLLSLVQGNIDFLVNLKLSGNIIETFNVTQNDNANISILGKLDHFSDLNFNFTVSPISFNVYGNLFNQPPFDSVKFSTNGAHGFFAYNVLTEVINLKINDGSFFTQLTNDKALTININDINFELITSVNDLKTQNPSINFKSKIKGISSNMYHTNIDEVETSVNVTPLDEIKGAISANVTGVQSDYKKIKSIVIDFDFDGISKSFIKLLTNKKLYSDLDYEDRLKFTEDIRHHILGMLKKGILLSAKKMDIDSDDLIIKSSGKFKLNPIKETDNLESNSNILLSLSYNGKNSETYANTLYNDFGIPSSLTLENNTLTVDMLYNDSNLTINTIKNPTICKELFDGFSDILDQEFNLKRNEIITPKQVVIPKQENTIYIKEYDPLKFAPKN